MTPDQARVEFFPQIGRAAFYAAIRRNEIPHLRFGRRIVIPRDAIEKLLETCERGSGVGPKGRSYAASGMDDLSQFLLTVYQRRGVL